MARLTLAFGLAALITSVARAEPWAAPGDWRLRNDLELLNDSGSINIPLTAWPVAWGDVHRALQGVDIVAMSPAERAAHSRVAERLRYEMATGVSQVRFSLAGAAESRVIRTFDATPRSEGEAAVGVAWLGERFAANLQATYAANPDDGDDWRPDNSYLGMALGNWMLTAGWQERWWGPGRDASMIMSSNARPMPTVAVQRIASLPSESRWFGWMGPWTLTSFMGLMDDERVVENGLLWGFRASFRPLRGFEIGLSRGAQWCGEDRECNLKTFLRLLHGNDNSGANVDPEDEPGNQLGGIDMRWTLPKQIPVALYMHWTAEDTRRTGASLHQWQEQVGVEFWGNIGGFSHRSHIEVAETGCRLGAFGEGSSRPNCAYNHTIFRSGYRYNGRPIAHGMDTDGLSYSLGSTLVDDNGNAWIASIRHIDINRAGGADPRHTISPTPQLAIDAQVSHERWFRFGRIRIGLNYQRVDDEVSGTRESDFGGFLSWSSM